MAAPVLLNPQVIASGVGALGSLGSSLLNGVLNRSAMKDQIEASKELMKYQWDNFQSPLAQVNAMAHAGLNPAVMLGQGGSGFSATPSAAMPTNTTPQIGGIADLGSFVKAMAEAKKADVDISKVLAETDAINLQNELVSEFGRKSWIYDVALKYQNVILANKTNDIKEQEKAMNEFRITTEKVISETKGIEKDMLQKRFDNLDTEIQLSNKLQGEKIKTEKSQQGALAASANASNASARLANAQASTEDALRDLKKFAIDLGNHMQGLEYGFNLDTYQTRLEKFANEAGIVKWTAFLNEIEAKDREAYNAVQRLIMGKGTKEDGKTLWNFINSGRQLIPFK